jgi:hypothetical protein
MEDWLATNDGSDEGYEIEAVLKKINRLTEEYQRQVARTIREGMEGAWDRGHIVGIHESLGADR